jgi:hypothetical protein
LDGASFASALVPVFADPLRQAALLSSFLVLHKQGNHTTGWLRWQPQTAHKNRAAP